MDDREIAELRERMGAMRFDDPVPDPPEHGSGFCKPLCPYCQGLLTDFHDWLQSVGAKCTAGET